MVPHITTILPRFTGEWALWLQPEAILAVCRGHCQLNGYICQTELSSGTLSSFRGHFMTLSGMSERHKRTTYPQSGRDIIAGQLS